MQEKQQYSYFPYILYFQFALIDDQPNAFFFQAFTLVRLIMFP